jgi:hypothetical protein
VSDLALAPAGTKTTTRLSVNPGTMCAMDDPGLQAAAFYGDDLLVREELVYRQDGEHSELVVRERDTGDEWEISCSCGYWTRVEAFERALLVAEGHLDAA